MRALEQLSSTYAHGAARALRIGSRICAILAAIIGAAALVGWATANEALTRLQPGDIAMRPFTAVAVMGVAFAACLWDRHSVAARLAVGAGLAVSLAISLVGLIEHVATADVELEAQLPVPAAGVSLILLGVAAAALALPRLPRSLLVVPAIVAAAIAGLVINAYALAPPDQLYAVGPIGEIALTTAIALELLAVAVLTAGGERGAARALVLDTPGGRISRWMIPALLLAPGIVSRVVHRGAVAGWYPDALERSLTVVLVTFGITWPFWIAARRVDRADAARASADRSALTDPLTGIANRRGFDRRLAVAHERSERERRPYAVVVLDADGLKRANDTFGHAAGDAALRAIGAGLVDVLRPSDAAARLGGDEFAVLLPDTAHAAAERAAARIGDAVNARLRGTASGGVTVSVGCAVWSDGLTPDAVIAEADRDLYRAKRRRRTARD
ncbi:MAG: GGDEF domain-containing protein [Chloroflexota bacterium]|nr:GGDEF domain-containing protein [Chloroflexota bacterium]